MKITIYNAISVDGYIARSNGATDWVSETDWDVFKKIVKKKRAIVMGRKTYETSGDDFPYDCELNVVMTRNKELVKSEKKSDKVWFTNKSLKEVSKEVERRGFDELLVIGGGKMNASFMKEGLVDEIILSVHPIVLGQGIKLFEGDKFNIKLKKTTVKELNEGLVQIRYKVVK